MSKGFNTQNTSGTERTANDRRVLIPASVLPETAFPTVRIEDNRYAPIAAHGAQRAKGPGDIDRHTLGILGEYAAAKFLGVPEDERIDTENYEDGDPGYDFEAGGWRVDVKTANHRWQRPSLMVDATKNPTAADFYVLAHKLAQQTYRIIGYAPASVVAETPTRNIGTHWAKHVREVEQDRITPLPASFADVLG